MGRGQFFLWIYRESFKDLLVKNNWANLEKIYYNFSLGDPLPTFFFK